jgi:hypothetical protein
MAEVQIVKYRIITKRDDTIISGHYIETMWDDVAGSFVVYHGSLFDNTVPRHVITEGPDLGAIDIDHVELTEINPIHYSFCNGVNLQSFEVKSLFPYATKISTPNHFSCTSTVCDLQISDDFTIQAASDFTTADGAVEVSATSSNGTIKYSLDPAFNYSSQGQTSGLFAGLYPGTYTITAKDALGCIDQITIEIPVPNTYGVLYRADYKDVNGIPSRVDILERGFEGAVTEVDSGPDPFIQKMGGDAQQNKFQPIMPTEAIVTLWSPSNFYFRNLFTQDERKYQVRWYKDFGNSTVGFTPATLPPLSEWTNVAGADTDWTTGTTPSVGSTSDLLKGTYAFEAGKEYTFDFTFEKPANTNFNWTVLIILLNSSDGQASFNSEHQKIISFTKSASSFSGTFNFIAPANATALAVKVIIPDGEIPGNFSINSFTDLTPAETPGLLGYELKWLGYVIPNNYSEPYIKDPYPVQITATDGLSDLKNFDFVDKDGNEYREDILTLDAIAEILAKTDLGINIQIVINRYETSMLKTASKDPLAQCKFNPATFYHGGEIMNCFDVLTEILKPFGGVIKQRKGKWFIANPEELVTTANYREFDSSGTLVTNGTVSDIVNIDTAKMADRVVMEGGSQMLEVVPAYGKLFFEHTLLKHASLIASYSFEPEDTYQDENGLKLFRSWNVNIANSPGATYGIKETKAFEGDYNFFLKYAGGYTSDVTGFGEVVITSAPINIEYEREDAFEFRFSYASLVGAGATGFLPWVKLKWMLKVGSYYYNETTGEWTTDALQKYNDIIIDRFNETLEKKVTALFRAVGALTTESAMVEFVQTSNSTYDFANTDELKATPTTTKPIRAKMKVNVSSTIVHFYVLQEGTDAESLPNIVRPNDYATGTNERIWVSEDSRTVRGRHVEYNFLDNVVLLHFPNGTVPPENITIERTNNTGIKIDFEEAYLLNDIDIDNINNSERTYKNFFKKLDGTPTQTWQRTYRPGRGKLLDLHSEDVVSQYKTPSNKITGSFFIDREVLPSTVLNEVNDGNTKYMFMGYELNDKHATIGFDIVELKDTVTGDALDAGFTIGFSLGFRS